MNTFKRKALFTAVLAMALTLLAGCASGDKAYATALQDTNDRIERMEKARIDADKALAEVLVKVAETKPELAAMAVSNISLARELGGGAKRQAFAVPERPKSFSDNLLAWAQIIVPGAVQAYGMNRSAFVAVQQASFDAQKFMAGQAGETARVSELANMAIGLKPSAANVTTYTFGRDGNVGGTQQNNNSTQTTTTTLCTAGNGAGGGAGGNGGNGGGTTGAGAPGAAGSSGGSGGGAC